MKRSWRTLLLGLLTVSCVWLLGTGIVAKAATVKDGLYQVPVKILKEKEKSTSTADQFFGSQAVARVTGAQTTLILISNGAQFISSMTVADQPAAVVKTVGKQALYQVTVAGQKSPLAASFKLTTPVGKMTEAARVALDWAKVKPLSDSVDTADLLAAGTTLAQQPAKAASANPAIPATAEAKSETTPVAKQYWRYRVLQGDRMNVSQANQYYTNVATVAPNGSGYRVTLKVQYAKSLKLGARAVVPESINGQAVPASHVTYGESGQNETMTYWFEISKLSQLTAKLIPGQIHVTVPALNMSQVFPVRFQFAASGAADQAQAAQVAALPNKTTRATPTANPTADQSAPKLPATGDQTSKTGMLVGLILLSLSLIWRGGWTRETR
ncbi:cell surface protein [Levilactobacillus paucivorans]|uniref:Cell surface protein n=1 Tax=Levilactobacillus paucivorans TaxID=616990 RepID=A0A0R2LQQ3_9LACO|nr:NEAT domain-containing protein [Levilactobacillus paucivorans]KRO03622.1 cell surface protein [Levilactobacillus paucivorans]